MNKGKEKKQRSQQPPLDDDSDVQLIDPPTASVGPEKDKNGKRKAESIEVDEEAVPAKKRAKKKTLPDDADDAKEPEKPPPKRRGRPPKASLSTGETAKAPAKSASVAVKSKAATKSAKVSDSKGGGEEEEDGDAPKKKKKKINLFGAANPTAFSWNLGVSLWSSAR